MRKLLIPAIAAAVLAASPAFAAEEVTVTVSYADLDLTTPEGRATLDARIAAAVTTVCGRPPIRTTLQFEPVRECRADAFEGAMEQVEARLATLPVTVAVAD